MNACYAIVATAYTWFFASFATGRQSWGAFQVAAYIMTFFAFVYVRVAPKGPPNEFMLKYKKEFQYSAIFIIAIVVGGLYSLPNISTRKEFLGLCLLSVNVALLGVHLSRLLKYFGSD